MSVRREWRRGRCRKRAGAERKRMDLKGAVGGSGGGGRRRREGMCGEGGPSKQDGEVTGTAAVGTAE